MTENELSQASFLASGGFLDCDYIAPIFMCFYPSGSQCPKFPLFIKTLVTLDDGPAFLQYGFILTNNIYNKFISKRDTLLLQVIVAGTSQF